MPKDGGIPLISNELIVMLPLDLSEIKRPHEAVRKLDPDFYDEYIEIVDAERCKIKYLAIFNHISNKFLFLS